MTRPRGAIRGELVGAEESSAAESSVGTWRCVGTRAPGDYGTAAGCVTVSTRCGGVQGLAEEL